MSIAAFEVPQVRAYRFITPNAPDAPKLARDHVVWLLDHAGRPVPVDTARLLVSEVVSNVHQHTFSPVITLTTTIRPGQVHVDVYDTSPRAVSPPRGTPAAGPAAEHGRGLLLLDALASRWGCQVYGRERPFGKSVWFELMTLD